MRRIIFIDDDPMILDGLRRSLRGKAADWDLGFYSSAREALRDFRAHPAAVIVTDMFMPDMDGFEVLKAIRAIDATVQVIAISGSGEIRYDTVLPAAAKLGAARTLVKPFRIEDLVRTIEEVLADSAKETDGPRPSS
jgi:DNA-binding NtrC family response regulator